MRRILTNAILTFLTVFVMGYILGTFYNGSLDTRLWTEESKSLVLVLSVMLTVIITMFTIFAEVLGDENGN